MEWILNDLSLQNKYINTDDFLKDLEAIFKVRNSNKAINESLLCPRGIGNIEVLHNKKFSQIIMREAPQNLRQPIMSWVSKNGPFWCDNRVENDEDYFEFSKEDVTDSGLGECARKSVVNQQVSSYSFSGHFDFTPLQVQHGIPEDIIGTYDIQNFWTTEQLVESSQGLIPQAKNWVEALERLSEKYQKLIFSPSLIEQISTLPFNLTVYDRMQELCRVLEEYLISRDEQGESTERTVEILNEHFRGRKAWFSDETDEDKKSFEHQLKFLDSRDEDENKKQYSFHGKIKTPQVRVYFEWPIPPEQPDIQIVYFGPKITKK